MVVAYNDAVGHEPICRVSQIALSAECSRLSLSVSARETCNESLKPKILKLFNDS